MNRKMKRISCRLAVLAAAAAMTAAPITAFAATNSPDENTYQPPEAPAINYQKDLSPEFAYSEEKWASLRDNVLEYSEIADLIHEYNPTVRSNRSTYNDQKNEDLTDVYNQLMSDAQDLWDQADAADTGDYTGEMSAAQINFSANTLAKTADQNYMDAEMYKLQYDQTEANLVYQAQQLMATWEQSAYTLANLNSSRALAQASYEAEQAKLAVGMSTQAQVLTSLKSVQDIDASILSAQKSADNVHRSLCLMLGWSADAEPEIRPMPQPDLNRIAAMNPEADAAEALANNYDVKYYEHQQDNVRTSDLKASAAANEENARNTVNDSLRTQYNTVLDTRDALNSAQAALELQTTNLNTAQAQASVGTIGALALQQQQDAYTEAANNVETEKLALSLAMDKYDWIKKGLTF